MTSCQSPFVTMTSSRWRGVRLTCQARLLTFASRWTTFFGALVMSTQVTILVNQKPHHLDSPDITPEKLRELAGLPQDYEVWRVVGSPDPEGQLPKDDVQITSP